MAWALFIGGVVMWLVDALCRNPRTLRMEEMSLPQAAWIGFAQIASAVFPGDLALNVNHRCWSIGRVEPERSARIFVFSFHADDGGRDRLRFAQDVAAWQR